jgi:hypothetical protein
VSELCQCKNEQRTITSKLDKTELWFFCSALLLNEIYLPTKFHGNIVLELCAVQSSKCKNAQRAITPKLGKTKLWFFCTTLLPNKIYLPTKFHVDISNSFRVMSHTKFSLKMYKGQ